MFHKGYIVLRDKFYEVRIMAYVIYDNDNYVRQDMDGFSLVDDIDSATKWKSVKSANNVCKHINANRKIQGNCFEVRYVLQENKMINPPAKPIELDYEILDKVKDILSITKQIEERKMYLTEQIQEIDLEIVDIEHAAEFYDLNASQGYKLYKLLHDNRIKRRELKNELEKINLFLGASIKSANMENLERSILGLNNRKYTPRINKELFNV